MKTISIALFVAGILWAGSGLLGRPLSAQASSAQSSSPEIWKLPQGTSVKDSGPRAYRFTVDYHMANTKGEIVHRERITGDYTRGLAGGEVVWKNVTHADAD